MYKGLRGKRDLETRNPGKFTKFIRNASAAVLIGRGLTARRQEIPPDA